MYFITDRTESDVFLGNEKGVYSYTDLNRVEEAVQTIVDAGLVTGLETKTDWGLPGDFSVDGWPVKSQMERFLQNISAIRDAFSIAIQLPESMDKLNWEGANNIEKVLQTALEGIL